MKKRLEVDILGFNPRDLVLEGAEISHGAAHVIQEILYSTWVEATRLHSCYWGRKSGIISFDAIFLRLAAAGYGHTVTLVLRPPEIEACLPRVKKLLHILNRKKGDTA